MARQAFWEQLVEALRQHEAVALLEYTVVVIDPRENLDTLQSGIDGPRKS